METTPGESITQLLGAIEEGDASAREQLWSAVYSELRALAQHQMAAERPGHTLQPTALVHEVFIRLFGDRDTHWANRRHFFVAAAQGMRQICIDDARKRKRLKRGGGWQRANVEENPPIFEQDPAEVLAIDEALEGLRKIDARKTEVVMLRYFAGLTIDETAAVLGISPRSVDVTWRVAKAWLHRELSKGDTAARRD